jgi:phospholipid/cholesterol/gamma-HCH transport system substrate-binding protein
MRMENERHYFTVGLFVLGGFIAILAFALWLTQQGKGEYETYQIRFAESVSGLSTGSVVKFRGVSVGLVDSITIDPEDSRLIRVDISLLKSTPLKADTKANLKMQGITGVVFIELTGGNPALANLDKPKDSTEVLEIPSAPSSINTILDNIPVMLAKLSITLDQINKVMSDKNVASIQSLLQHGDAAASDLRSILSASRESIPQTTRDAAEAISHLNNAAKRVDRLSEQVEANPASLLFPPDDRGIPAP